MHELIVIGGTSQGLSAAILASEAGVENVRIIEQTDAVVYPEMVGTHSLDVGFGESVTKVSLGADCLHIETDRATYTTKACIVASRSFGAPVELPLGIEANACVHTQNIPTDIAGRDILVVGKDDRAVVLSSHFARNGARSVVLAAGDMNPDLLSDASQNVLKNLEHERLLTPLFRSVPQSVDCDEDGAMVHFDRRTPDLQFDHVVYASETSFVEPERLGIDEAALHSGRLLYTRDVQSQTEFPSSPHRQIIGDLAQYFAHVDMDVVAKALERKPYYSTAPDDLAADFYNATITYFEPTHSDLWVLRVRPDNGGIDHRPGQYTTLALGYWESRIDDVLEKDIDERWNQLVRRSYSISNRIFNDRGYLAHETENGELEFYIVLVPPTESNIPGLTPRLALKRPGDRIFLGSKVTGRYTLNAVTDPDLTVVFLSTGTGEAPHNSMIVELLRNGHRGKILSAVSVRNSKDLGYLDQHRRLEELYDNYSYMPMPTREPNIPKRYIQDVIVSGELEEKLGAQLDSDNTHVFMCGNPSMIGAPDEVDGKLVFPETKGVIELLVERGFTIDHRKSPGNIHFEKYW
jgi:ferredoxin--NADP+ reductase